jgi:hypothetical protein
VVWSELVVERGAVMISGTSAGYPSAISSRDGGSGAFTDHVNHETPSQPPEVTDSGMTNEHERAPPPAAEVPPYSLRSAVNQCRSLVQQL